MTQIYHQPPKHTHLSKSKILLLFDKSMYAIALIAPIMTIPQLLQIWIQHESQGVSLVTWASYTVVSCLWFLYGIFHKDKVIILANTLLLVLDAVVVIGILIFH